VDIACARHGAIEANSYSVCATNKGNAVEFLSFRIPTRVGAAKPLSPPYMRCMAKKGRGISSRKRVRVPYQIRKAL